jgi:hypothetical protein
MTVIELHQYLLEVITLGRGDMPVYLGDWNERYARPVPLTEQEMGITEVDGEDESEMTVLQLGDIPPPGAKI